MYTLSMSKKGSVPFLILVCYNFILGFFILFLFLRLFQTINFLLFLQQGRFPTLGEFQCFRFESYVEDCCILVDETFQKAYRI
jgi:hypothetical protein